MSYDEQLCKPRYAPRIALVFAIALVGCSGSEGTVATAGSSPQNTDGPVVISWTANRESAVNAPGGGYRVYYSNVSGFSIAAAPFVDVPYVSGAAAPTSASLDVPAGSYFIRVVAYSALNPTGSEPSAEIPVNLTFPTLAAGVVDARR